MHHDGDTQVRSRCVKIEMHNSDEDALRWIYVTEIDMHQDGDAHCATEIETHQYGAIEIGMYQDGDVQLRSRFTEMDMRDCDRDASR